MAGYRALVQFRRRVSLILVRSTVLAAGLPAGIFAIVYSYRKQRVEEAAGRRADAENLSKRYQDAAEQLGHDSPAVRLAGAYAMSRLADEDQSQRRTIVSVLCAYLRMPYDLRKAQPGEREVRHTVMRIIADHLSNTDSPTTWCGMDLDFTGAVFDGGSFSGSHFVSSRVSFAGAHFIGGHTQFDNTTFSDVCVSFGDGDDEGAVFSGGQVTFTGATFASGVMSMIFAKFIATEVSFGAARFESEFLLSFSAARLDGSSITFGGPIWEGADIRGGRIDFAAAKLVSGYLSFDGIALSGGSLDFDSAKFSGATLSFIKADISGRIISFKDAEFQRGEIIWDDARIAKNVVQPWPLPPFRAKIALEMRRTLFTRVKEICGRLLKG